MQRKSLTIKCPIDSLYEMIPTKFPLFSLYTKNRHQISCFSYAVGTLVLVVSGLQNFEKKMVALRFIYTARKRTRKWIVSLIFVAAQCEQLYWILYEPIWKWYRSRFRFNFNEPLQRRLYNGFYLCLSFSFVFGGSSAADSGLRDAECLEGVEPGEHTVHVLL